MKYIEYAIDPDDSVGARCDAIKGEFKCHRRRGHPSNTRVIKHLEDDSEVVIEFNHRTLAFGGFVTW